MLKGKKMNTDTDYTLFYLFSQLIPKAERVETAWRLLLVYLTSPASLLPKRRGSQFRMLAARPRRRPLRLFIQEYGPLRDNLLISLYTPLVSLVCRRCSVNGELIRVNTRVCWDALRELWLIGMPRALQRTSFHPQWSCEQHRPIFLMTETEVQRW